MRGGQSLGEIDRDRLEHFRADDLLDDRIIGAQRFDRAADDGVAIDRHRAGRGLGERGGETALEVEEVRRQGRSPRRAWPARGRVRRINSANGGRLPSRSIRVGRGADPRDEGLVKAPDVVR